MQTVETVEDFLDAGYMAEDFEACDPAGNMVNIRRQCKPAMMQLFISIPFVSQPFLSEITALDRLLQESQVPMRCFLILSVKTNRQQREEARKFKKLQLLIDNEEEFGQMYGTQIISRAYKDLLYKALFLVSKDGAVFYVDMPKTLQEAFDLQRFIIEANKAYSTYDGTGCH